MRAKHRSDHAAALAAPLQPAKIWLLVAALAVGCSDQDELASGGSASDADMALDGAADLDVADGADDLDSAAIDSDDDGGASTDAAADTSPDDGNADADQPKLTCKSDKDCQSLDQVCEKTTGTCVQCNADVDCAKGASCKAHHCVEVGPVCQSSKDCASTNQVCDSQGGHCVDCLGADDCVEGKVCAEQVCVVPLCVPDAKSCLDTTTLGVCSADGGQVASVPCKSGQLCKAGVCAATTTACAKGEKVCQSGGIATCKADGSGFGPVAPCDNDQTCLAGVCVASTCSPGSKLCGDATTLLTCGPAGDGYAASGCTGGQFCLTSASSVVCGAADCAPGSLVCFGDKIAECSASGQVSDISGDCALSGKTCKDGVCQEAPAKVCVPNQASCDNGAIKACKADGMGWIVTACGANQVCKDGVCASALCTPGAKACVDTSTEKTCATDGGSWTKTQACPAATACTSWTCAAEQGCLANQAVNGASCGDGKVCEAGLCVAASGCAACAAGQQCVDGACVSCKIADSPAYVGYVLPYPSSATGSSVRSFAWAAKFGEWWFLQDKDGFDLIERRTADFSLAGTSFATKQRSQAIAVFDNGDYATSQNTSYGPAEVRRMVALQSQVLWAIKPSWTNAYGVAGLASWKDQLIATSYVVVGSNQVITFLDAATGALKSSNTLKLGASPINELVAVGDIAYTIGNGDPARLLLAPTVAYVPGTSADFWPWHGAVGPGVSTIGFDGSRLCMLRGNVQSVFCYDVSPGCSGKPAPKLDFPNSQILTLADQAALTKLLGTDGKVWKRCAPTAAPTYDTSFFQQCGGGPTVLLWVHQNASSSSTSTTTAGVYTSQGWPTAAGKQADTGAFLFNLASGLKAVPISGTAELVTKSNAGLAITGAFSCTVNGKCTANLSSFACSDGKTGTACQSALLSDGVGSAQDYFEAFRLQP